MTRMQRVLALALVALAPLTLVVAHAYAQEQWPLKCHTCFIPEACYPGTQCTANGSGDWCYPAGASC